MLQHLDPPILNALFPFQRDGVNFMVRHNGRVLLADEPGLGKTVQVGGRRKVRWEGGQREGQGAEE